MKKLAAVFAWLSLLGALGGSPLEAAPLKIAVAMLEPAVMEINGKLEGFEVDLWREIAAGLGVEYSFEKMAFGDLLKAVEDRRVDMALAGITVTAAREGKLDFSHALENAGQRILVRKETEISIASAVSSLLKADVLRSFLYLGIFVLICGHILWWAERGQNSINEKYFPGVLEAIWFGCVTMTTVGYGDIAPKKWLGRLTAVLFMFTGIAFFGWFVAVLSSSFQFERLSANIDGPSQLANRTVATKAGTVAVEILQNLGAKVVPVAEIGEAYGLLAGRTVDAVVFDEPSILYFLKGDQSQQFALAGESFHVQHYGFAYPEGSELREKVDRVLLKLREEGTYGKLREKWFDGLAVR